MRFTRWVGWLWWFCSREGVVVWGGGVRSKSARPCFEIAERPGRHLIT
jgi:hypothetical protein